MSYPHPQLIDRPVLFLNEDRKWWQFWKPWHVRWTTADLKKEKPDG